MLELSELELEILTSWGLSAYGGLEEGVESYCYRRDVEEIGAMKRV